MTQKATKATKGLGNTKAKPKKDIKGRKYCFTLNNYTEEEVKKLTQDFSSHKYIFGREVGLDKKTPHIQGYVEFKNAVRFSTIKNLIPRAHIERCRGSTKKNFEYCSKEGNYITNIDLRTFKEKVRDKCLEEYKEVKWKDWQEEIINLTNDSRTIHWYWEESGNVGKSFLCKYLALTRNVILCEGKKADIFNQVNSMMEQEKLPEVVICDIPRTSVDFINYGALEQLKNGCLYSGKYEGGLCVFPPPLVICLANTPPDRYKLSLDRWHIVAI